MSPPLLVPYAAQSSDGYCLPACVSMVLAYWGITMSQRRIARALDTGDAGTPFSRIQRLTKRGLQVESATSGVLAVLKASFGATGIPPVVAVHGAWLLIRTG